MDMQLKSIGRIRTPYHENPPHQPDPDAEGDFYIDLDPTFEDGLYKLASSRYIYVLFYFDRQDKTVALRVKPPWADGVEVGLFASRSPHRPNPIGLSIVRLKQIDGARLYISGIDVLDNTPLLDIKPYVKGLDNKDNANRGWQDEQTEHG
jgi:tRNA-Thr(GGU) m(6)t(6)A37 methyltransferase TsaA